MNICLLSFEVEESIYYLLTDMYEHFLSIEASIYVKWHQEDDSPVGTPKVQTWHSIHHYKHLKTRALVQNRPLIQGPNQALVSGNNAPGTRETFSPGWWLQPGLKVDLYSRLVAPTGSKALVPASGVAQDWKVTFSPGWIHQPGLKVPPINPAGRLLPPRARPRALVKI